jgi:hypothetical protein
MKRNKPPRPIRLNAWRKAKNLAYERRSV